MSIKIANSNPQIQSRKFHPKIVSSQIELGRHTEKTIY